MRRVAAFLLACFVSLALVTDICLTTAFADQTQKAVAGKIYDLGEDDKYELSKAQEVEGAATRFYVKGDISSAPENNGFVSFAVNSGNMAIMIDDQFETNLFEQEDTHKWHIISDKTKVVDGIELAESIGTGAIIVQTSRDGRTWITTDTETDIYNKRDSINTRNTNGEPMNAFYRTTNVQMANGCYYRIIVAYRLQREIDPSQYWFVTVKNTEEKERIEVYQFYAYDPRVNRTETLNTRTAYEFKKLCSAITFHNEEKRLMLEDIKGTQEILALFMKVYDADEALLQARVDRLENVVAQRMQQPAQPVRVIECVPEEEKPETTPTKPRTLSPDINAKYGGKYKILSAKEPDKALSVYYDRSFMGGLNSMNKSLELVSKNNLHVSTWTIESCGQNIYRLVEISSGLVVEYDPASGNTSILFVKKWKEKPSCIWEIRDNRDKTVSFLSNADIEKGLKTSRQKKVVVGRTGMKDSHWILERV